MLMGLVVETGLYSLHVISTANRRKVGSNLDLSSLLASSVDVGSPSTRNGADPV